MTGNNLLEQVKELPTSPGIYRYFDAAGHLLYIGKAGNLRRRVSSYFQRPQEPRIAELVRRIARIEIAQTDSVIEALFKEAYEINAKQPPFNVRSKDDKTFIFIGITKEPYPRVIITRPTRQDSHNLKYRFGPYTSADAARKAVDIVRHIIPFRTRCKPNSHRACLDNQIGLCPGVCTGEISEKEYAKTVTQLKLFLEGNKGRLVKALEKEMATAAAEQRFEAAANIRNRLFALQHIRDVALLKRDVLDVVAETDIPARIEAYDISNISSDYAVGGMVVFANGYADPSQYRKFQIKTVLGQNDLLMMEEVLRRRLVHTDWPMPDLLLIDGGEQHLRVAQRVLRALKLPIAVMAVAKGPARNRLDIYTDDAQFLQPPDELRDVLYRAREEAHRFAITFHRARRKKGFLVD